MGKRTNQNDASPEVELTQTQTEIPPEVPPIEEHDLESNPISSNPVQDSDPPSREEEPPKAGKKRVQNLSLKGKKLIIGDGQIAAFDAEGICEVDDLEAERLATIPGYKLV